MLKRTVKVNHEKDFWEEEAGLLSSQIDWTAESAAGEMFQVIRASNQWKGSS